MSVKMSILGRNMDKDCVFCKLVRAEIPRTLEYEDDDVIVFKSIRPVAENHLLIVPKKHISTFRDLVGDGADRIILKMVSVSQKMIQEKGLEDGYRLAVNGGKYQEVLHLHLHLLGGKLESGDVLNNL